MLDEALKRMPRKGSLEWPVNDTWKVQENLHEWAKDQGWVSAAVFVRSRSKGRAKKRGYSYRLVVAKPCPWVEGRVRFHTASLDWGVSDPPVPGTTDGKPS